MRRIPASTVTISCGARGCLSGARCLAASLRENGGGSFPPRFCPVGPIVLRRRNLATTVATQPSSDTVLLPDGHSHHVS